MNTDLKKKHRRHNLTVPEARKLVRAIEIERRPVGECLEMVGFSKTTATASPHRVLAAPAYQTALAELRGELVRVGVGTRLMARRISEGLQAMVPIRVGTKLVQTRVPDHHERGDWWDRAAGVLGIEEKHDQAGGVNLSVLIALARDSRAERGLPEIDADMKTETE